MDSRPLYKRPLFYALLVVGLLLLSSIIIPTLGKTSCPAPRSRDASNLRQIAQASLIYANSHQERFPEATDVWDYARLLAEADILNEANMWQSRLDPATQTTGRVDGPVLAPAIANQTRALTPEFRACKLCFAVALGKLTTAMPATTPIAWTRGLQPDGTWAKHSPYGGEGGHIAFLGGNVRYFRNLTDEGGQLTRFDGQGQTANILEALPPGTRIGEYVPTPEEQKAWSK